MNSRIKPSEPHRSFPVLRMELRYCSRCGTLHVRPAGAETNVCTACIRALAWLYEEEKR
jgi:hypothetical protein